MNPRAHSAKCYGSFVITTRKWMAADIRMASKLTSTSTVPRVTTVDVNLRSEQADEPLIRQTY